MSWNNEIARLMNRSSGNKLIIGVMTGDRSCSLGGLILTKEDLYIAEHLLNPICTHADDIASTYIDPLKSGDMVLLFQLSDSKFVIIEKVVPA